MPMNELKEKSGKIFTNIVEIEQLAKCLCQSIDLCGRDEIGNCGHLLPLAQILENKCKNLTYEYDEFDLNI